MKLLSSIGVIASLFFINNVEALWKPTPGTTWNDVLGDKNFDITKENAEVIEVDYETSADKIELYHSYGKKVICYFSGGTIESWRADIDEYMAVPGLVKNTYDRWADERWLDFRVEGLKPLIIKRMNIAKNNKCDAIEIDNLDAYQIKEVKNVWDDPVTDKDTVVFARWLAEQAHSIGLSVGLKNIAGLLPDLASYYDFAVNESCINYVNECGLYRDFVKSGKAVFGLTYGDFDEKLPTMCRELNGIGISMIFKESQKLAQAGFVFDGEKYCGSGYSNGYTHSSSSTSSSSVNREVSEESVKSTTTVKPTTTTKYYTTTVKPTTTTTKYYTTTVKPTTTTTKYYTTTVKPTTTTKKYYNTTKKYNYTPKYYTQTVITKTTRRRYNTSISPNVKVVTRTSKTRKVIVVVKTVFKSKRY